MVTRRPPNPGHGNRICVVTTVKDTPANLDRFVESNLAAGADHLFMFVDDADREIHAHLGRHPHVTAVRTGSRYWQGRRPTGLNSRQVTNANLVNTLLTAFPEVGWLFHIDGDECLHIDRARLLALPPEQLVVRLRTFESVATTDEILEEPLYKRPPDRAELALLHLLGVIERPQAGAFFRGHLAGKSGIRPSLVHRLRIHAVERLDRTKVDPFEADFLGVLHHESTSVEEFIRKWTAHLAAERPANFRGRREELRAALSVISSAPGLSAARRRELFTELHRRHIQDDVALLDELGLLLRPQPEWHRHEPIAFEAGMRRDLDELLTQLKGANKRHFQIQDGLPPGPLLAELMSRTPSRSLRRRLELALEGAASGAARRAADDNTAEPQVAPETTQTIAN